MELSIILQATRVIIMLSNVLIELRRSPAEELYSFNGFPRKLDRPYSHPFYVDSLIVFISQGCFLLRVLAGF